MAGNQNRPGFSPVRTLQKFVVSTFVVCTFVAYALHERIVSTDATGAAATSGQSAVTTQQATVTPQTDPNSQSDPNSQADPNAAPPTLSPATDAPPTQAVPPTATARPQGQYRDGTYTGSEVDAFYGFVRVQAVIHNGRISNVSFLEYPNDRRTSVRINSVAVPYLQSEAVQAQTANVDIISGATLTSEAFAQSLQDALNSAKN